jgi:hypothetical protein
VGPWGDDFDAFPNGVPEGTPSAAGDLFEESSSTDGEPGVHGDVLRGYSDPSAAYDEDYDPDASAKPLPTLDRLDNVSPETVAELAHALAANLPDPQQLAKLLSELQSGPTGVPMSVVLQYHALEVRSGTQSSPRYDPAVLIAAYAHCRAVGDVDGCRRVRAIVEKDSLS